MGRLQPHHGTPLHRVQGNLTSIGFSDDVIIIIIIIIISIIQPGALSALQALGARYWSTTTPVLKQPVSLTISYSSSRLLT